ncbi:MAG: hypothetical protein KGL39_00330 [Patescibacteria group bacterium]|nr:hypothetical protein [Patescibacteria group bacterium]
MMTAAQRYNPEHDSKANFATYAWRCMWHYVQQYLISKYMRIHVPLYVMDALRQEKLGIPSDYPERLKAARAVMRINRLKHTCDSDDTITMQWPSLARQGSSRLIEVDKEQIQNALNCLPWMQRRAIIRRYGFDGQGERNYTQVAAELDITRQGAFLLCQRARKNLKLLLTGKDLPKPGKKVQ